MLLTILYVLTIIVLFCLIAGSILAWVVLE